MIEPTGDRTVFVTWVYSARQRQCARLLIDSIRAFGGSLSRCPIWLFEANPEIVPCDNLAGEGVHLLPLVLPETVRGYALAHKVYACARAEALAGPETESLIWLSPEVMIVQPPTLFDLGSAYDAAIRPVHIQNVGLLAKEPVDPFWRRVYEAAGVQEVETTVESFVDVRNLRAYYNSAAFAVRPGAGVFGQWFACFEALVCDQAFRSGPAQDEWHQVFLHQAVLSALVVAMLEPERIRLLPPDYGYPYNLHGSVPPEKRAKRLNELACVIYEERSMDPDRMDDIEIHEPLRSWLSSYAALD